MERKRKGIRVSVSPQGERGHLDQPKKRKGGLTLAREEYYNKYRF